MRCCALVWSRRMPGADDPDDVTLAVDDADTPHLYAGMAGFLPDRRSRTGYGAERR